MAQYLDSNNQTDKNKVEDYYIKLKKEAEKRSANKRDLLLKEITYYRIYPLEKIIAYLSQNSKDFEKIKELYNLYNGMSEYQVKQYLNLYYEKELKKELILSRTHAVEQAAKDLYKKGEIPLHDVLEIAKIDYMTENEKEKKTNIKEKCKEVLKAVGVSTFMGLAGFIFSAFPLAASGNEIDAIAIGLSVAILSVGGGWSLLGVVSHKDKKAINQAKKFGIYDLIMDSLKADDKFNKFENELINCFNNEDIQRKVL